MDTQQTTEKIHGNGMSTTPASTANGLNGLKRRKRRKLGTRTGQRPQLSFKDFPFVDPCSTWDPECAQTAFAPMQDAGQDIRDALTQQFGSGKLARILSTVRTGDQYQGEKVAAARDKLYKQYEHDVLSGNVHGRDLDTWRGPHGTATINLKKDAKPFAVKSYMTLGRREDIMRKIFERNLYEFGWLEKCMSPWAAPLFSVPKPPPADPETVDGWRLVVDFRKLNEQTEADAHPLPSIEHEIQKRMAGKIFTVLDLKHGFHQMKLREEDRKLTAMPTPLGILAWKCLPMGVKNWPPQFQRMMNWILGDLDFCTVYIDDIIISTEGDTEEEILKLHCQQVQQVLERLRKYKLVCGPKKGKWFLRSVEFCGSILENGTRKPSPGKLLAVQFWQRPTTISQLRGFLGVTNFYHQFIPLYANMAGPLTDLLKVGKKAGRKGSPVKVNWTPESEQSFRKLKEALCNVATLHVVDSSKPFYIRTDASKYAIGAVVEQVDEQGRHYPLAYWSRKLTTRQRNWPPREQEAYAIVCILRKFRSWFTAGQRVEILTD